MRTEITGDRTITVSDARATFPQILQRVEQGEEVSLTRHGKIVAVIVRPDTLALRRAGEALSIAAGVRDALETGRNSQMTPPSMTAARADELVAELIALRAQAH